MSSAYFVRASDFSIKLNQEEKMTKNREKIEDIETINTEDIMEEFMDK